MKVWLCLYHHKHGVDVSAYASERAAHIGACDIVLDYLEYVDEPTTRKEIVKAISGHDYGKAMDLYSEGTQEAFEIVEREIAELDDSYLDKPQAKAHTQILEDDSASSAVEKKRITAKFRPQGWVNDDAIDLDPEGPTDFDVTDVVLAMGKDKALKLEDNSCETDVLRELPNAPKWIRDWSGPFVVEVEDAIRSYFEVTE